MQDMLGSTSSVQFSCLVLSYSLRPHGLQHTRLREHKLPELAQTHSHRLGDAIQPSHPLSSPSPPTFNLSQHQGLFQWVGSLHQVAEVFNFSISPSNEYSGLISFRTDWFDLLAVQGTFKSLLQHHSSKASILQCSAFFMFQLLYPYMTTEKTITLTRWTFVGKVMSLLFNMLSRFVIDFLLWNGGTNMNQIITLGNTARYIPSRSHRNKNHNKVEPYEIVTYTD